MLARWEPRESASVEAGDAAAWDRIAAGLRVPPIVARLLAARRHDTPDAARAFLDPKLTGLADPADTPGLDRAAARIAAAVRDRQPIVIYGDYDVDGVTASAILWHTIRAADPDAAVEVYIPHRLDEGYGLNAEAVAAIAGRSPTPLIVTVDCGITAVEPARVAAAAGADLIITDHHRFDVDALPEAYALVHPELAASAAAAPPCGAGVAFKLAWQVAKHWCGSERVSEAFRELLVELLPLAALGTIADLVPLVGENRTIAAHGLRRIKRTKHIGLNALIDAAGLRGEKVDAYHVGFVLGPRLNACGRMGHAREAVKLLTGATRPEAEALAKLLTDANDDRRATERSIVEQAVELIETRGWAAEDRRALVVADGAWHPGVVGIVAARLVERYHRPAVVLCVSNGTATGSARSVEGVSIHDALTRCAGRLTRFGGHAMAAGLALRSEAIDAFRDELVAAVNAALPAEALCGRVSVDAELGLGECSIEAARQLGRLGPFGRGNPRPKLLLRGVTLARPPERVGRQGAHLKLRLRDGGGAHASAIGFGMGELAERLAGGVSIDLVAEMKLGSYAGRDTLDLLAKDLRVAEPVEPAAAAAAAG